MANIKIDKKIAKYRVQKPEAKEAAAPAPALKAQDNVIWMHEKLERPEVLIGSTYKIKTPVSDHAMYDYIRLELTGYVPPAPGSVIAYPGNNCNLVTWPVTPGATTTEAPLSAVVDPQRLTTPTVRITASVRGRVVPVLLRQ